MMKRLFLFCLLVGGCPKPQPQPNYPDASDASAMVVDGAVACTAASDVCAYCVHMRALHCPEGEPTAAGATCETVTANTQRTFLRMDLRCRATASSCDFANNTCR